MGNERVKFGEAYGYWWWGKPKWGELDINGGRRNLEETMKSFGADDDDDEEDDDEVLVWYG